MPATRRSKCSTASTTLNQAREQEAKEAAALHPDQDRHRPQQRPLRGRQYGLRHALQLFGAGRCVNLASRLEGQSKTYDVPIIIGARTAQAASDKFALLELDISRSRARPSRKPFIRCSGRTRWPGAKASRRCARPLRRCWPPIAAATLTPLCGLCRIVASRARPSVCAAFAISMPHVLPPSRMSRRRRTGTESLSSRQNSARPCSPANLRNAALCGYFGFDEDPNDSRSETWNSTDRWRACAVVAGRGGVRPIAGAAGPCACVKEFCARCHAIGKTGKSPNDNAPPFRTLGRSFDLDQFPLQLEAGISPGHPDMPAFKFKPRRCRRGGGLPARHSAINERSGLPIDRDLVGLGARHADHDGVGLLVLGQHQIAVIGFAGEYLVRQVPQVPVSQELGTSSPLSRSTSRMVLVTGTSSTLPRCAPAAP